MSSPQFHVMRYIPFRLGLASRETELRSLSTLLLLIVGSAACAGCEPFDAVITGTTKTVAASADDGETFTGVANSTNNWDTAGVIRLASNRGLNCAGHFAYEGNAGPNGKATLSCNDGETAEVSLVGLMSGTGYGTIGQRQIVLKWGSAG